MSILKRRKEVDGVILKRCRRCKEWLPEDEFALSKRQPDNKKPNCSPCATKSDKSVYARNPEKYSTKYFTERARRVREKNPEKYSKKWAVEKRMAHFWYNKKGKQVKQRDILAVLHLQGDNCFYCFTPINSKIRRTYHIDHYIPWQKGGSNVLSENAVIACPSCNMAKGTLDANVFIQSLNDGAVGSQIERLKA